ncbi:MAG: DUF2807 domain-containing protein [Bacteroidales bacterium]|nr:DUF2807 domain-containing protein [Bacteroidales bacterium]
MRSINRAIAATAMAVIASVASSCYIRISDEAKEEIKKEMSWRAEMSEEVYQESEPAVFHPGEFTSLKVSDWMDVTFIPREGEPEVIVSGTHRSRDEIRVENEDGTLKIFFDNNSRGVIVANNETVTVYAPGIRSLDKNGSGDIHFENTLSGESLNLDVKGSGDVKIDGCEITGEIIVGKSGSGDMDIHLNAGSVSLTGSGSGDITLEGETKSLTLDKRGSGFFYSGNMEAESVTIKYVSGSGEVTYREKGKVVSAGKQDQSR